MADRQWTCPNDECGVSNDGKRYKCRKCYKSKPYLTDSGGLGSDLFANESLVSTPQASGGKRPIVSTTTQDEGKVPETEDVKEAIHVLLKIVGKGDDHTKPLNILLIGKPGAGKSEFINSTAAALSQVKWEQYADSGRLPASEPITIRMKKYLKCCNADRYKDWLLPTLTDVAGLSDEGGEAMIELLTLLLYGHIKDFTPVQSVYNDCKELPLQEVRNKYKESYEDMRIDRVIFVASCEDDLPEELMKCVRRVVKPLHNSPQQREIPLSGVLTKKDKVNLDDPQFQQKRDRFELLLGLDKPRLLVCSNYCDDIDKEKERLKRLRPDLDLPIVEFFQQVCSRARSIINEDERLRVPGLLYNINKAITAIGPIPTTVIVSLVAAIVAYAAGTILLPSSGHDYEVIRKACRDGIINNTAVCSQLPDEKSQWNLWSLILAVVVGFAVSLIMHFQQGASRNE